MYTLSKSAVFMDQAVTSQDPVTSPNELYELRKPIKCQGNQAYYETVSDQALPSSVVVKSNAQELPDIIIFIMRK